MWQTLKKKYLQTGKTGILSDTYVKKNGRKNRQTENHIVG